MLTDKAKDKAKDKAALKAAAAIARRHYAQTRDARGATKTFLDRQADIKKGFALAEAAKEFYDKTDKLANGIQDYLDAREKTKRAQKDWDDATDQMMEVIEVIEKVEHCKKLAAENSGNADARPQRLWFDRHALLRLPLVAVLQTTLPAKNSAAATTAPAGSLETTATERAALVAQRVAIRKRVDDDPGPTDAQLRAFLKKLPEIRAAARALAEQAEEAWPPVAPLALELQDDLGPELTRALVEQAAPAWTELVQRYDRLLALTSGLSLPGSDLAATHVLDESADAEPSVPARPFVPPLSPGQ